EGVEKIAHHHRRRDLAVVVDTLAHVADEEMLTSGEQRLQKQVAVVVTLRAISAPRPQSDPVESRCTADTRKRTIVHAEQADHLERNGAHRHESAKRHTLREEVARTDVVAKREIELRNEGVERQRLV